MKIVIPAITQHRITRCLKSLRGVDPADIIVVDNTPTGLMLPFPVGKRIAPGQNLGVARSWNLGVRTLQETDDDWLVICSQSVCFGRNGGRDLTHTFTDEWGAEYVGLGWHLNAFSRKFLDVFGYFDENFYPAYMEDTDALYRMGLLDLPSPRENGRTRPYFDIDAECMDAGALKDGAVEINFKRLDNYYKKKWGGLQSKERFKTPFNEERDINWWPGVERAGIL